MFRDEAENHSSALTAFRTALLRSLLLYATMGSTGGPSGIQPTEGNEYDAGNHRKKHPQGAARSRTDAGRAGGTARGDGIHRRIPFREDEGFLLRLNRRCRDGYRLVEQFPDSVRESQTEIPPDEIDGIPARRIVVRIPLRAVDPDLMLFPQSLTPFSGNRFSLGQKKSGEIGVICHDDLLFGAG